MRDTMGIIYTGDNDVNLRELTRSRSVAAVPFAGRYRIIDFILSNMVNSNIHNVGLITQNNYHSLMDHLDSGKNWDLDRKKDGLFILPPYVTSNNKGWYNGRIDALYNVTPYIKRSTQKYVVFSGSSIVCNLCFDGALEYHKEKNADITILYKEEPDEDNEELSRHTLLSTDSDGKVVQIQAKPRRPKSKKISMETYIIEKDLLEMLIDECVSQGQYDFTKDLLIKNIDRLNIYGFECKGYLAMIDSVQSYFKHSMELLNRNNRDELFNATAPIYTKVKDEVPTKYGNEAEISNSLLADGCIIEGKIYNSIIFRGVRVEKDAVIKNSIVMQNSQIQENALLENVILDKEVLIRKNKRLVGQANYPVVIGKKAII